ncbi:MAG: nuclear transport factor 2 family protein [Hyphomicrobiaceae bacterium]|nr:nuclear transport factor 2 family protein [Hyphomicrobiaceae bacterium]
MTFSQLLERFATAVEQGDGDALAALFTEDGVYDDYFFGPCRGRPAIKAMLAHFYEGGEGFRWEFLDPVANEAMGYAHYRFSYTSRHPDAKGARVCFDGISRLRLSGGLIAQYSEVFDRGMALAQQAFDGARIARIAQKYAARLKEQPAWAAHLAPPGERN